MSIRNLPPEAMQDIYVKRYKTLHNALRQKYGEHDSKYNNVLKKYRGSYYSLTLLCLAYNLQTVANITQAILQHCPDLQYKYVNSETSRRLRTLYEEKIIDFTWVIQSRVKRGYFIC